MRKSINYKGFFVQFCLLTLILKMTTKQIPKVLIVDDDQFLLGMYSMKFQSSGFEVETATSGEEALNKLRDGFLPDVLVLDVVMPVMDGLDLLESVRKEKLSGNAAVVILSNLGQQADIDRAKKLGVDGYIVKASAIPSEVVSEVKRVLEGKHKM